MKKAKLHVIFLSLLLSIGLSSCAPKMTVFTRALYSESNWTDSDLTRIQFYLSDDIILHRSLSKGETQITSGKIKMVNGERIEEIVFERGTPGVFIQRKKDNHFAIAFEDGDDTKTLTFGPNNSQDGNYALLAIKWSGHKGTIKYDNKKWKTYNNGRVAKLLIDLKKINQVDIKKRKVGGRKIPG